MTMNSRRACDICHLSNAEMLPVRSPTHREVCRKCIDLLRYFTCKQCHMWTDPKWYDFRKKVCYQCRDETRQKGKPQKKLSKEQTSNAGYIDALEKRVKRLLVRGETENAIPDLTLLIAELRDAGRATRADQLEQLLNQFLVEETYDDAEPTVLE